MTNMTNFIKKKCTQGNFLLMISP